MTNEPEWNAHARCQWCHALRPVKESIIYNGYTLCRDGDCLDHLRAHHNASYLSGYQPKGA